MIANRNAAEPDIVLVGAGIMSATLGTVLKELEPTLNIVLFETLHDGYTGKGVGTTGMFFHGVDIAGNPRTSFGGYLQSVAYTFGRATVGGSYGVSYLDTANAFDTANVTTLRLAGTGCLVHKNESWIGFVRYKLTSWVNLQAEYIHTRDQNTIGQSNNDDAVVAGTTFFW
jgi:Malate:quinone oxidoreductase (Mqo)